MSVHCQYAVVHLFVSCPIDNLNCNSPGQRLVTLISIVDCWMDGWKGDNKCSTTTQNFGSVGGCRGLKVYLWFISASKLMVKWSQMFATHKQIIIINSTALVQYVIKTAQSTNIALTPNTRVQVARRSTSWANCAKNRLSGFCPASHSTQLVGGGLHGSDEVAPKAPTTNQETYVERPP